MRSIPDGLLEHPRRRALRRLGNASGVWPARRPNEPETAESRGETRVARRLRPRRPPTPSRCSPRAVAHHQIGRMAEAESLYRQVLAVEPDHAETHHYLGVLAWQIGRADIADGDDREPRSR